MEASVDRRRPVLEYFRKDGRRSGNYQILVQSSYGLQSANEIVGFLTYIIPPHP